MKKIWEAIINWGLIGWTRRLFHVVRVYGHDVNVLATALDRVEEEMKGAVRFIKRATKVHADVCTVDGALETTVILCGRYRGRDYVQTFRLPEGDMAHVIDHLKHMQRAADVGAIDVPIGLDAVVKRELKP